MLTIHYLCMFLQKHVYSLQEMILFVAFYIPFADGVNRCRITTNRRENTHTEPIVGVTFPYPTTDTVNRGIDNNSVINDIT